MATDVVCWLRNLMAPDEFKNLGFAEEKAAAALKDEEKDKKKG